ncbi:hypothetical protein QAD02_022411 [Eretmocerus hayati]|uniref:Uncharacterized protein n=1 Tax=Eretmocerus hayati TaxID=131215 RepID=A0ACC2PT73_9HYME|nr:hypothetical protein QAD02_022411 [Eretmocerus hayati]
MTKQTPRHLSHFSTTKGQTFVADYDLITHQARQEDLVPFAQETKKIARDPILVQRTLDLCESFFCTTAAVRDSTANQSCTPDSRKARSAFANPTELYSSYT